MTNWRSASRIVLATVLFVVGQMLIGPWSVFAQTENPPPVPPEIAVPSDVKVLFQSHARGVQIYDCTNGQWAFHAPRAILFDPYSNGAMGKHYGGIDQNSTPGPWWESKDDGSRIRGGEAISAPSTNPDSIPLLRLKVLTWENSGIFSQVTYIHRLNTNRGKSPTGACESGARREVPYTADYYFYGQR